MIFFWVIVGALLLKYPFYEFGPRYANATGNSLLSAYRQQGKWAVILFMLVIFINMFAVTGAVAAVSAWHRGACVLTRGSARTALSR